MLLQGAFVFVLLLSPEFLGQNADRWLTGSARVRVAKTQAGERTCRISFATRHVAGQVHLGQEHITVALGLYCMQVLQCSLPGGKCLLPFPGSFKFRL